MSTATSGTATRPATRTAPSPLDLGLLLARVIPFGVLAVFGAQKLFGAFGGSGLSGTEAAFAQMGYHPALFFAILGGASELVGGLLLMFGLLTPLGAAMAMGVMINAFSAVSSAPLSTSGFPIVVGGLALALAFTGPGRYSLDAGRPWQRTGLAWGGLSVALAVVTAVASLLAS
ncbi:DoxX family protein [Amycolatopsis cynarae]|uniref:DoxX family protein n=1 Tax=Amycolatopsis cynarae TaxID=2995223 RepID=A0ABY7ASR6_9PSEU|nr:DoxX family protein [Amycolatopsis sp. HUAS 11-8]WAL62985.1 DoxX family protein [Amycolatopsis sp. HUAS 11-8]